MKKSAQKVGNKDFEDWLKKLDPVTRVKTMSSIAKTQLSAGLKGSVIKASWAQLSQRCQVMLIKLTGKEILSYTRRKSIKRLKTLNNTNIYLKTMESEGAKGVDDGLVQTKSKHLEKKEIYINNIKNVKKSPEPSMEEASRCHLDSLPLIISKYRKEDKTNTTSSKLKKKYQELFGDDLDDLLPEYSDGFLSINSNKVKNYYSTVHVNIYNTRDDTSNNKNGIDLEKKNDFEQSLLSIKKASSKKLRIDLSVPTHNYELDKVNVTNDEQKKTKLDICSKYNKTIKSKAKKSNSTKKNKSKQKLSDTDATSKDPDAVFNKTLWSSLGMESPTERSENIIKSYPFDNPNNEETKLKHTGDKIKHNNASFPSNRETESSAEDYITLNNCNVVNELQPNKETVDFRQMNSTDVANSKGHGFAEARKDGHINQSLTEDSNVSGEVETVCKISKTFSLASQKRDSLFNNIPNLLSVTNYCENSDVLNSKAQSPSKNNEPYKVVNPTGINSRQEDSASKQKTTVDGIAIPFTSKVVENEHMLVSEPESVTNQHIETISILDDSEDEEEEGSDRLNNNVNEIPQDNCSALDDNKVGTIRVKSLGTLMKPEFVTQLNCPDSVTKIIEAQKVTDKIENSSNEHHSASTQPYEPTELEVRFYLTDKHYFDSSVHSKIPKLGELLHLAIADFIRKEERIKRAEQLSSEDLINDEKQRAEKDFSDMMRIRGNEFAPLFENIFSKFDQHSRLSLFLSLFCKILAHAAQIDPANRNHTLKGRDVIRFMFSKRPCKDRDFMELLSSGASEFIERVDKISNLIAKCTTFSGIAYTKNPLLTSLLSKDAPTSSNNPSIINSVNELKTKVSNSPVLSSVTSSHNRNVCQVTNVQGSSGSIPRTVDAQRILNTPNIRQASYASPEYVSQITSTSTQPVSNNNALEPASRTFHQQPVQMQNGSTVDTSKASTPVVPSNVPLQMPSTTLQSQPIPPEPVRRNLPTILRRPPTKPIIISSVDNSRISILGLNSKSFIVNSDRNGFKKQCVKTPSNNLLPKSYVARPTAQSEIYSPTVASNAQAQPNYSGMQLVTNIGAASSTPLPQVPIPSSSHCHPFVKRMPISGKLRMMFEYSNSSN